MASGRDWHAWYAAHKEDKADYYAVFKAECLARQKDYDALHKEERKAYNKAYYEAHKEELIERARRYRQEHKKEVDEYARRYHEEHKEQVAERNRRYKQEHKDKVAERARRYRQEHKEQIAERRRARRQERRAALAKEAERRVLDEENEEGNGVYIYGCDDCFYFGEEYEGAFYCAFDKEHAYPQDIDAECPCFMKQDGERLWHSMFEKPRKKAGQQVR